MSKVKDFFVAFGNSIWKIIKAVGMWFASWVISVNGKHPKFVSVGLWLKNWFVEVDGKPNHFIKIGRWFKSWFVSMDGQKPKLVTLPKTNGFQTMATSVACAFAGLILGFFILLIIKPEGAWDGILTILKNFWNLERSEDIAYAFGTTLANTAPLIMTGLSVMFAYKAGLFNIGVAGQYTIGISASLWAALAWRMPWWFCIIFAMVCGALWGCLPGILKAFCNVNEVISCIMFNWIGLYVSNMILSNEYVMDSVIRETLSLRKYGRASIIPSFGLDVLFGNNRFMTISIILAVLVAVVILIVMTRTTFGFELKATGNNKNAAKYAGMKEKRNIILTMAIAGALAAMGAALVYLTDLLHWRTSSQLPSMGFDGIAAAFLGGLNPIGLIFAAYFLQHITTAGSYLNTQYYSREIANLITSIIIYLCAFVLFVKDVIARRQLAHQRRLEQLALVNEEQAVQASTSQNPSEEVKE